MKLIKQNYKILTKINSKQLLKDIELCGRTAYKSENKITNLSYINFIKMIIKKNHLSVIEHEKITIKFIVDRGISHELVRHRLASFTQESTRYCNYSNDKFGNSITFIDLTDFLDVNQYSIWKNSLLLAEISYKNMIKAGVKPQFARSVLPNSLKTEIIITANLREWKLILEQRTSKTAHPQIKQLMNSLLEEIKVKIPIIFDDI